MHLLRDLEARARATLPATVFDYFAGGAGDERSLDEATEAWQRLWLVPRQLAADGPPDLTTELLGVTTAAPVVLAPAAAQRLLHPDGELAAARAAAEAGLTFTLSTRATTDLGDVAAVSRGAPRWFQLYVEDRETATGALGRLREHGFTHVVLTVDLPVPGRRERELRHGPLPLPEGVTMATHLGTSWPGTAKPMTGGWKPLTWADVGWAAEASGLPVLVKGVLHPDDARRALDEGAAGVVVSNHGARQLDGVVPSAVALPDIVAAIGDRAAVLVDGGLRSGADIARALALGADAVMVGRPYLWGLAADGAAGVAAVLDALVADLGRTLALLGARTPDDLGPEHVRPRAWS